VTSPWEEAAFSEEEATPLEELLRAVVARFAEGAALPEEVAELAALERALQRHASLTEIRPLFRDLSHAGYLRGAIVLIAETLRRRPRADLALLLARELADALAPRLGILLARAALTLPEVEESRVDPDGPFVATNLLLADTLLHGDDAQGALRHFEAVLSVDVDHARALRGWSAAVRALERRGLSAEHRSRGLALLDGLEDVELSHGLGLRRYELGRPLGRGRHAVVYQAYDRRVGREVAIKRLLADDARSDGLPGRVLQAKFFNEARTLLRVRSPYVVALLDVQPRHRFIAMDLCRGGNLRLAMRRGLMGPRDLDRVGRQLRAALRAVHAANAVHRDVKPANILVRAATQDAPIALADFGLAMRVGPRGARAAAGTLRYLAPDLRGSGSEATPASDLFSAGVLLLELVRTPEPLPAAFDRLDDTLDASSLVPDDLPGGWTPTLRSLLSSDPEARSW